MSQLRSSVQEMLAHLKTYQECKIWQEYYIEIFTKTYYCCPNILSVPKADVIAVRNMSKQHWCWKLLHWNLSAQTVYCNNEFLHPKQSESHARATYWSEKKSTSEGMTVLIAREDLNAVRRLMWGIWNWKLPGFNWVLNIKLPPVYVFKSKKDFLSNYK